MKIAFVCLALVLISMPAWSMDNYWDSFGSPQLEASLAGANEFDRGDTVKLRVDLSNYGRIIGLDADKKADSEMEDELSDREFEYEQADATALNITATLRSGTDLIDVQSDKQVVESLKSGNMIKKPLDFTVEIAGDAPAGTYPMSLELTYDYQKNVEVDAEELDAKAGLKGFQVAYSYQKANLTFDIPLKIRSQADFDIVSSDANLSVGEEDGEVSVVYMNTGEEAARDAAAILSISNPFSSTDDQAFIGTVQPGENKTVVFRIDVDSGATAKDYVISSEIRFTDVRGDSAISDSMKIPVNVADTATNTTEAIIVALLIAAASGFYIYRRRRA